MERLTEKGATYITCDNEHDIIVKLSLDDSEEPLYDLEEICNKLNRLAELEDMLENGVLIKLPCRLGQPLYTVDERREFFTYTKEQYTVNERYAAAEIAVCEDGEFRFYTPTQYPECLVFGKDIFVSKEEAEMKLKELTEKQ
ncbi:MAG: hypothetical protein NC131_18490 [Roseburia sp.]|nr:hypothetical protein [Roseburia sp.]